MKTQASVGKVEVLNLSKTYENVYALDNVCFSAGPNEVLAIVGSNGAGKSTLFRLLSTLIKPTAGTAGLSGNDILKDAQKVRQSIGAVFTDPHLYARLTVRETLKYFGRLHAIEPNILENRIGELLSLFNMNDYADRRVEVLSRGMRQKVVIAKAILHSPNILLLDEPTTGLDIEASAEMIEFIRSYAREHTVLFATHSMTEIVELCHRVAVFSKGRISDDLFEVGRLSTHEVQQRIFNQIGLNSNIEQMRATGSSA